MDDKHLTFSQRYGYESLPEPMRLEELSDDLRCELWNVLWRFLQTMTGQYGIHVIFEREGVRFVRKVLGKVLKRPEDGIYTGYKEVNENLRMLVLEEKFNVVFDLFEIIVNYQPLDLQFRQHVESLFNQHAAYWLDTSQRPFQFFPRSSKEQGEATQRAIETIREGGMGGAETHLRQAAEYINAQRFGASVADSIHAVESVARSIDPKESSTLGSALDSLEQTGLLKYSAIKGAFEKLYGYTNAEPGIRHAILGKGVDVGLDEAMFMFGACASFAAYLTSKHKQAETKQGKIE